MAEPRITVAPPARSPRKGGLLSVAEVREGVTGLAASTNVQFMSEPCDIQFNDAGFCYSTIAGTDKTFAGVDPGVGVVPNFALYYGVECWISDDMDFDRRANAALDASEGRAIETKFNTWLLTATSTTATTLVEAIALADQRGDADYIGQYLLHLNRGDAVRAYALGAIDADRDGNLWTPNGTPVVTSSSYTAGSVYLSGAVTVLRSAVTSVRTEALADNLAQALAERVYAIIVDCDFAHQIDFTA